MEVRSRITADGNNEDQNPAGEANLLPIIRYIKRKQYLKFCYSSIKAVFVFAGHHVNVQTTNFGFVYLPPYSSYHVSELQALSSIISFNLPKV